jgi:hypothetical protein
MARPTKNLTTKIHDATVENLTAIADIYPHHKINDLTSS